jgi:hypothetical protein
MKMVYKAIAGIIAAFLLISVPAAPVQAAAISPQCAALGAKQQKIAGDIAAKETPLNQLRVKNTYNTSQSQAIFKTKVANLQKETDKKIEVTFKKLHVKGKNTVQKAAIVAYETEFKAALTTLRTTQDAARTDYINTFNSLNSAHRSATDSQLATLKTQIAAAFAAASPQCQKMGVEKATAQLIASIKLAQDKYNATPNIGMTSLQPALQSASDTFKAASDKAAAVFKATVQQSRIKLKAAVGDTKYIF